MDVNGGAMGGYTTGRAFLVINSSGETAEIMGVSMVTWEGKPSQACFQVKLSGILKYVPVKGSVSKIVNDPGPQKPAR